MTSHRETNKIKVIDLKALYNFLVDNFLFEIIYQCKITFEVLTFEIWIFQKIMDGKTTKTKVLDLKQLYA
jgi:hypothetical protein